MYRRRSPNYGGRRNNTKITLLIGLAIALFSVVKYCSSRQVNPLTGETQYVSLTEEQEVQLGIQSAPRMAQQHGGLYPSQEYQDYVKQVGNRLVQASGADATGYQYDFHLLADPRAVNAFALPGGQCFITYALFNKLKNEDQLAGVLGHEIGHVVARHGAERLKKQELTQGLTSAAVIGSGDYNTAQMAQVIGNVINMSYGRDQELQSDDLGVRYMMQAGYNPEHLIGVMDILEQASGGGERQPEFFSTHPNPDNRREKIQAAIEKYREQGL